MSSWLALGIGLAVVGVIAAHLDSRAAWRAEEASRRRRALMKELEKH